MTLRVSTLSPDGAPGWLSHPALLPSLYRLLLSSYDQIPDTNHLKVRFGAWAQRFQSTALGPGLAVKVWECVQRVCAHLRREVEHVGEIRG